MATWWSFDGGGTVPPVYGNWCRAQHNKSTTFRVRVSLTDIIGFLSMQIRLETKKEKDV